MSQNVTESINDRLNAIAKAGSGTLKVRPDGASFNVHLSVREVSETTFIRVFDTSLYGEQPTELELVIVQTRSGEDSDWSTPQAHYRNESGLTGATHHEVVAP